MHPMMGSAGGPQLGCREGWLRHHQLPSLGLQRCDAPGFTPIDADPLTRGLYISTSGCNVVALTDDPVLVSSGLAAVVDSLTAFLSSCHESK